MKTLMRPRYPLLCTTLAGLALSACDSADEGQGESEEVASPALIETDRPTSASESAQSNRAATPASRVRNARFPLEQLLSGGQPALNAALRETPHLDADAIIADLRARDIPTWNQLLSSFSSTGACEWDSDLLPPGHPLAGSHDQVSCLIPTHEEAASADRRDTMVLKGPVLDFLVSRRGDSVALVTDVQDRPLGDKFSRDLAKARLAVNWLLATDPAWQEIDREGSTALRTELDTLSQRRSQLRPLLEGIRSYQDDHEGRRPANLQQLALRGHLVSPALANWDHLDGAGNQTSTPILYFERPPLLIQADGRGLAVILAAPVDNDDQTRTIGTAGGEILDLPAHLVAEAIAGRTP